MNLLDLALRLKWSSIAERAATHPHEIAEQDEDGLTVLHWACCNDPPVHTIQVLLAQEQSLDSSYSRASLLKDKKGMTPLHNACACHASPPVISALVRAVPESAPIADNDGWNALHYICCNVLHIGFPDAYEVSLDLLSVEPALVHEKDNFGRTPLFFLCHVCEQELQPYLLTEHMQQLRRWMGRPPLVHDRPSLMDEFWAVAAFMVCHSDPDRKPLLHSIVSLSDCPDVFLRVAIQKCPERLLQQDDMGNTPLHLAACSMDEPHSWCRLGILVNAEPKAAMIRNNDGDLPLAIVLGAKCGWTSGHADLLKAHPAALESCGIAEVYYPYVLARTASHTTIFELLRAKPSLIHTW